jgi:hypothetical protein
MVQPAKSRFSGARQTRGSRVHLIAPDLASDKSPRLHDVAQPAAQFSVGGDLKKEMIVDEPRFATLALKPTKVLSVYFSTPIVLYV